MSRNLCTLCGFLIWFHAACLCMTFSIDPLLEMLRRLNYIFREACDSKSNKNMIKNNRFRKSKLFTEENKGMINFSAEKQLQKFEKKYLKSFLIGMTFKDKNMINCEHSKHRAFEESKVLLFFEYLLHASMKPFD